jgi:hypothetical protein
VCQELLDEVRNYQNFLSRAITGDKTWVHFCSPETKLLSSLMENPILFMSKVNKAS